MIPAGIVLIRFIQKTKLYLEKGRDKPVHHRNIHYMDDREVPASAKTKPEHRSPQNGEMYLHKAGKGVH